VRAVSYWTEKRAFRCRNHAELLQSMADKIERDDHRRVLRQVADNYEEQIDSKSLEPELSVVFAP
jgi:predicted ArsR family transcriptional regulator